MDEITVLQECVIKVEEIKEEVCDETESVKCVMLENATEEEKPPTAVFLQPKKEMQEGADKQEEDLEPLFAVFLQAKEEPEDDTFETLQDPLASSDESGPHVPIKEDTTFKIADAASRCAEVAVTSQQKLSAVSMETERRGTNKSALRVLAGLQAEVAEPHAPSPATRLSHSTLCRSDVSGASGSKSKMPSSSIKKQYRCQNCSCVFTLIRQLNRHLRSAQCRLDPSKCSECNNTTDRSELNEHESHHTGLKLNKCRECDFTAAKSSSLKIHQRTHTGIKPYKCTECDFTSAVLCNLKAHQRIHSGIKPYKCIECDFATADHGSLKRHKRIHSGIKPYKCTECNYSATQSSALKAHKRIHSGVKPYKCTQCDYTSAQGSDLKKHERIHSGVKPYGCRECDYATARSSDLKKHQRTHSGRKR